MYTFDLENCLSSIHATIQALAAGNLTMIVNGTVERVGDEIHFDVQEITTHHIVATVVEDDGELRIHETVTADGDTDTCDHETIGDWIKFLIDGM